MRVGSRARSSSCRLLMWRGCVPFSMRAGREWEVGRTDGVDAECWLVGHFGTLHAPCRERLFSDAGRRNT